MKVHSIIIMTSEIFIICFGWLATVAHYATYVNRSVQSMRPRLGNEAAKIHV